MQAPEESDPARGRIAFGGDVLAPGAVADEQAVALTNVGAVVDAEEVGAGGCALAECGRSRVGPGLPEEVRRGISSVGADDARHVKTLAAVDEEPFDGVG